jgi:dTDP-4-amino-4,6-dideoxygalactose transaminase
LPDDFLPIARPDISDEDVAEVVDTLRSGWLTYGPKTQRFEKEFRAFVGAEHAVAVNSCTAGMHLALLAAGIGPGDEVITSTLTFASTANVIVHVGATPVLADICRDDLTIDPEQVERRITPRTKAIMPVDYAGHPPRLDDLMAIGRRHGVRVIEDAATAVGSQYMGRQIGSVSDATVFSFYAIKNLATGEGGMLTTDELELAEKVRSLRNNGLDSNAWKRYAASGSPFYTLSEPGLNYRMTDVLGSLALGQLRRLPEFNAKRARLAAHYTRLFERVPEVETPTVRPDVTTNWHLYVVRLRDAGIERDAFVEALKARGIGSAVHYLPVHYHPYYQDRYGFKRGQYPVAEVEFERLISLPLFPLMGEREVERVVRAVEEVLAENRRPG